MNALLAGSAAALTAAAGLYLWTVQRLGGVPAGLRGPASLAWTAFAAALLGAIVLRASGRRRGSATLGAAALLLLGGQFWLTASAIPARRAEEDSRRRREATRLMRAAAEASGRIYECADGGAVAELSVGEPHPRPSAYLLAPGGEPAPALLAVKDERRGWLVQEAGERFAREASPCRDAGGRAFAMPR